MRKGLFAICYLLFAICLKAQSWQPVGGGTNAIVSSFTNYNNVLYVGGDFTSAGGVPAGYIAIWNGTKWDSVGAGASPVSGGGVETLLTFDSILFIGGQFKNLSHLPCASIGQWNGANYDTMSCGLTNEWGLNVRASARYSGIEYFGGNFDTVTHNRSLQSIASWNGSVWDSVGCGINGLVTSMAIYNNILYVGGQLALGNNYNIRNLISWNGTKWDTVGASIPINGPIYSLCVYNGKLYAAGSFSLANNLKLPVNNIACWDGTKWDSVDGGVNSIGIAGMTVYDNELVVGGYFDSAGHKPASEVAAWDGANWHAIGNGLQGGSNGVWGFGIYDSTLYAGGDFTASGSTPLNNIAMWSGPLGVNTINKPNYSASVFPNPSNGVFTVEISNYQLVINNEIEVYNMLGECVYSEKLKNSTGQIDLSNEAKGLYFYRFISPEGNLISSGKLLLE